MMSWRGSLEIKFFLLRGMASSVLSPLFSRHLFTVDVSKTASYCCDVSLGKGAPLCFRFLCHQSLATSPLHLFGMFDTDLETSQRHRTPQYLFWAVHPGNLKSTPEAGVDVIFALHTALIPL